MRRRGFGTWHKIHSVFVKAGMTYEPLKFSASELGAARSNPGDDGVMRIWATPGRGNTLDIFF